jgi:hypothetical protein
MKNQYNFPNPRGKLSNGSPEDIFISFTSAVLNVVLNNNGNCHHNTNLIAKLMKKDGFDVEVKKGIFTGNLKIISHSWIECNGLILEQDCHQLGIEGNSFQIIQNPQIKDCYEVSNA